MRKLLILVKHKTLKWESTRDREERSMIKVAARCSLVVEMATGFTFFDEGFISMSVRGLYCPRAERKKERE
jgi:hypothetical protein